MFEATCHCGNVKLVVEQLTETFTACTCSVCHRYGAHWAYYRESQVTQTFSSNMTFGYIRGEFIVFNLCRTCGCLTHWSSQNRDDADPRMGINSRLFPRELTKDIPVRLLDGADTWEYLN